MPLLPGLLCKLLGYDPAQLSADPFRNRLLPDLDPAWALGAYFVEVI